MLSVQRGNEEKLFLKEPLYHSSSFQLYIKSALWILKTNILRTGKNSLTISHSHSPVLPISFFILTIRDESLDQ